jgi:hypothetical protein
MPWDGYEAVLILMCLDERWEDERLSTKRKQEFLDFDINFVRNKTLHEYSNFATIYKDTYISSLYILISPCTLLTRYEYILVSQNPSKSGALCNISLTPQIFKGSMLVAFRQTT